MSCSKETMLPESPRSKAVSSRMTSKELEFGEKVPIDKGCQIFIELLVSAGGSSFSMGASLLDFKKARGASALALEWVTKNYLRAQGTGQPLDRQGQVSF